MCKSFPSTSKAQRRFASRAGQLLLKSESQEAVMHVLLTGASGFIGNAVLRELLRRGHCVSACSREPERLPPSSPAAKVYVIDFAGMTAVEQWLPYLAGVDAIVNIAGGVRRNRNPNLCECAPHGRESPCSIPMREPACRRRSCRSGLRSRRRRRHRFHLSKFTARSTFALVPLDWFPVPAVAGVWRGRT